MGSDFEILDYRQTSLGGLMLRRRRVLSLGGVEVFEVKLGDEFLMSSLFHQVEVALADMALAGVDASAPDVVVGGLGLGYTAVATLKHREVRSLLVIEALAPVIEWHREGRVPLGSFLTGDARCRLVHGDFFAMAAAEIGFDIDAPGRRFDAILLDIDHSPRHLLHHRHASFYAPGGLGQLATHLHPGGVFALWSDDPPDEGFLADLRRVFADARAEVVTFANQLLGHDSASTVYIASKPIGSGRLGLNRLKAPAHLGDTTNPRPRECS